MLYRWHMAARYGSRLVHDHGLTTDPQRATEYARRRYCRADALTIVCRPLEPHPVQEPLLRLLAREGRGAAGGRGK